MAVSPAEGGSTHATRAPRDFNGIDGVTLGGSSEMAKKLINLPGDVVRETIEGFLMMHPREFRQVEGCTAMIKTQLEPAKVALVIGGGSGHEPIFLEFIGKGLADAVVMREGISR